MLGVFDSGVGGLTVVRAIRERMPNAAILYVGDTARMPYGSKSPETITRYAREISEWLLQNGATAIVIGCHTASSLAADDLRKSLSGRGVPVFDVVRPGLDEALQKSQGRIGIIGTRGTITSGAHEKYLLAQSSDVQVFSQACPLLAPLVEEGFVGRPETESILRKYLAPLLEQKIDTLILACTHYPLLREQIKKIVGDITIVDPATSLAEQLPATESQQGEVRLIFTDEAQQLGRLVHALFGKNLRYTVQRMV